MKQAESKVETTPFECVGSRFNIAAGKLGLDGGLYQVLLTPDREFGLAIPVQMNNGRLKVFQAYPSSTIWREGRPTEASVTHLFPLR